LDRAAWSGVSQWLSDTLFNRRLGGFHIERHFAAEKVAGVQAPQN
jgi:hypothetical protein